MITKSIPNLFTLGNLFLGMVAIMLAQNGRYSLAAIMVIVAMLLDGLDGRVARALNAQSEFGKELDSLSDVISFGIAPAFIMYSISLHSVSPALGWIVTSIFPMCGALRLARFNVKPGIPGYFIGLPIPAAGSVLATLSLFHKEISAPYFITAMLLLSYLMVSSVRYPNFKKIGFPKKALWIAPWIVALAVFVAVKFPDELTKLIFFPLVVYALYGLKQNVQKFFSWRRRKSRSNDDAFRSKNS